MGPNCWGGTSCGVRPCNMTGSYFLISWLQLFPRDINKNKTRQLVNLLLGVTRGERFLASVDVYPPRYFLMKRFEAFSSFLDSDGAENCLKNPENFCLNDGIVSTTVPLSGIAIGKYQRRLTLT